MRYYPVNLDIQNKNCLVIGGGSVAERKIKTLIKCGALVTAVAIKASDSIRALADLNKIDLKIKEYEISDLKNMFLVIGATNNNEVNSDISEDAKKLKVICNIADYPEKCDFILPSIVKRGDLVISISTSGKSPALAKKLRKELGKLFGEEYAKVLNLLGIIRKILLSHVHEPEAHKSVFEKLINLRLLEAIKTKDANAVKAIINEAMGDKYFNEASLCDEIMIKNILER
ncbi:MAG: bifunctional precorrin-2 dehydrogenase/sirohydrochlorin ferrochelatase [Deltaproteobacteria bacterium]|nr:bifunctional precorrin-2 dehydrogenase/sirohydrochlorin ferrochelatase [Deltaproteobacteria bacterium]